MTQNTLAFQARAHGTSSAVLALGLLAGAALAGCASEPPRIEPPVPRLLGASLSAYSAPEAAGSAARRTQLPEEPKGAITLRDALAAALLGNPDLAAFSWEIRVREARALQAGLLPNPELAIEVENLGGSGDFSGADQAETTLALGQLIELGGKRMKRRRVAELDAMLAGWDYEARRVEVFAEVTRAFAELLVAQERLRLSDELLGLAEKSLNSVTRQVRAGAASPVERTRAEVTLATQTLERRSAEAELAAARVRLAGTWGGRKALYEKAEGDLFAVASPPTREEILERLDENPELARWVQEIELRKAVVALEDARRAPNLVASAGMRRLEESNDTALVFGVSMPLQVFDRNQGARLAAQRDLTKVRHQRMAVEVGVQTSLEVVIQELAASYQEVVTLREQVLPKAERAYRDVRQGYLRGLFRYLDVLDAQRSLFELRSRELDALRAYHSAVAEVERLTGTPIRGRP
ncbi:MAG: TolC family protein [Myxococcota bacterium]